ncbi:Os09g0325100, partial [Oryza sativa Japonica Group]
RNGGAATEETGGGQDGYVKRDLSIALGCNANFVGVDWSSSMDPFVDFIWVNLWLLCLPYGVVHPIWLCRTIKVWFWKVFP